MNNCITAGTEDCPKTELKHNKLAIIIEIAKIILDSDVFIIKGFKLKNNKYRHVQPEKYKLDRTTINPVKLILLICF
jgi:hypothetical protein